MKVDGFVKSPFCPIFVIPAPAFAGVNFCGNPVNSSSSVRLRRTAFAGVTAFLTFYEITKVAK